MIKAKLALYIGKGDWTDKAIRLYTQSPYSHSEIVIGSDWYSSSPRDGKVRKIRNMKYNPEHWEFVEIEIHKTKVLEFFKETKDSKYDWLGIIFSQLIPLKIQNKKQWFCSEWCAKAMEISGYSLNKHLSWYNPKRIAKVAKDGK